MKRFSRTVAVFLCLVICFSGAFALCGCESTKKGYKANPNLDTSKEVSLRLVSSKETWPEMDTIIAQFEEVYPNCSIVCEYIEVYSKNLPIRLNQSEQKIDIFRTTNIQETTVYRDNAYNLLSDYAKERLDLSQTYKGLVDNFKLSGTDDVLYAIPYAGVMRGMYVNVTLLKKFNLKVPTNRAELLHCCEVLAANDYLPFHSPAGIFAQQLIYPYICNSIVNGGDYEKTYAAIENIDDGISEYFRDAYAFLYEIVEKGYYDYKRSEEEFGYTFKDSGIKAKEFLNITETANGVFEKQDDLGKIAFMLDTQSFITYLDKTKSDYHSEIEYKFITAPVGEDGGYAYLSPDEGFAINNQSDNLDWSLEFLNFFFTPEINTQFADLTGKIPNTADALSKFDVDEKHASNVGQVTFSYGFYKVVTTPILAGFDDMIGMSKMNAKKYMTDNGDGTYSITFTLEDYMARLEAEFQKVKAARG